MNKCTRSDTTKQNSVIRFALQITGTINRLSAGKSRFSCRVKWPVRGSCLLHWDLVLHMHFFVIMRRLVNNAQKGWRWRNLPEFHRGAILPWLQRLTLTTCTPWRAYCAGMAAMHCIVLICRFVPENSQSRSDKIRSPAHQSVMRTTQSATDPSR